MGFFVPPKDQSKNSEGKSSHPIEIQLLAISKRIGLSFAEVNELRNADLLELADCYSGNDKDKTREAEQSDIDAFYGR